VIGRAGVWVSHKRKKNVRKETATLITVLLATLGLQEMNKTDKEKRRRFRNGRLQYWLMQEV